MALITVLPRKTPGFTSFTAPAILPVLDHREAFEQRWPNFMHFLPYWLEADGLAEGVSVRATKGRKGLLEQAGYSVKFGLLVLEVDYQPVVFPDPEVWGSYSTRRGYRFFAHLAEPIGPDHYEAEIRRQEQRWVDIGITIDPQCRDWTHIWALPRVVRDGAQLESTITYPTTTYTPGPPPVVLAPPRRSRLMGADRPQAGRTPEERIAMARRWLDTAPVAVAGDGGDSQTYRVAQGVVRGHWLTTETATALMAEWNDRCLPPWPMERIEYKVKEAAEKGKMAMGALLFDTSGRLTSAINTPTTSRTSGQLRLNDAPGIVKNRLHLNKEPEDPNVKEFNDEVRLSEVEDDSVKNRLLVKTDAGFFGGVVQKALSQTSSLNSVTQDAQKALASILQAAVPTEGADPRALVTDSLLARFVLAELQAETPLTALDDVLYRYIDNEWVRVTKPEWSIIADAWEGRSPDDDRFKPITLNFARKHALKRDLCDRLDTGSDEHPDVLFWTPDGGIRLDGSLKQCIPPVGVKALPSSWDENAECPRFMRFIEQIVPNQANRDLIQEFVGLCHLSRGVEAHTVLCFEGPGRNGKSTLISLISKTFSPVHRTSLPPQAMEVMERRSALRRAKINIVGEISSKALADTTDFKLIVTGDLVSIRNLRQDQEVIYPFAGHLFATNLAPSAQDESIGFVSKWMIVYFASIIPQADRIERLGEIIWEDEAVGICRWFMEGARRASKTGLHIPQEARDEMKVWQDLSDPVRQILAEVIEGQEEISLTKTLETVNLKLSALRAPVVGRDRMVRYMRAQGLVISRKHRTHNVWVRREG